MEKSSLKKMFSLRTFYNKLITSFKRAFGETEDVSGSSSNSQFSVEGSFNTFLSYDELRRINACMLRLEQQKAEAIRNIRERHYCI